MRVVCARSCVCLCECTCAHYARACAPLRAPERVRARVRVRARAPAWGSAGLFKSESSPRLSSSFLGRYRPLRVPIQGVTRLDSPMVQGHRLDQSCGVVGAYTGMLTFDRQDHDRRSQRTSTARQRRQEEQDYRSNQDYDAGSLEHGAHSVRSFG